MPSTTLSAFAASATTVDADASSAPAAGPTPAAAATLPPLEAAGGGVVTATTSGTGTTLQASSPAFTGITLSSTFPLTLDTFTDRVNDDGEVILPADFNVLVLALSAVQAQARYALKSAPGDLADRLTAGERTLFT